MSGCFALLRRFAPEGLHEAASAWRRLAAATEEAAVRHRSQVDGPLRHARWEGRDADRAFAAMERNEQVLGILRVESEAAALALETVADRMQQARTNLANALYRAEEWNLPVSADGTVGLPRQTPAERHDPDAHLGLRDAAMLREHVQARIDAALDEARDAGDRGARALGRLSADVLARPRTFGSAAEAGRDAAQVAGVLGLTGPYVPAGGDPQQAAQWWRSLSPEERQRLLALRPEEVGRLDGLPAAVRDEANRLVLEQQLDTVQAGDAGGAAMTGAEYNRRANALIALKDRLDRQNGEPAERQLYLLGLDPRGDGRAVVALGDPDTADHTAVLVPGTGTTLASTPGQIARIGALQDAARQVADPGRQVSVISWLGYDAPEIPPQNLSVTGTGRAEAGAADLRRFTEGLRSARDGREGHLTVIGHSYGTTAVGAAARGGQGLGADDIVAVGSPGMAADRAAQLQVEPGHVWVGTADDDRIRDAAGLTLGADPAEPDFGGRAIAVDTHGHSGYWDPDSQSLLNQGRIIAGKQPGTLPG